MFFQIRTERPSGNDGNGVLDLRVFKQDEEIPGQLTPPRDGSPLSVVTSSFPGTSASIVCPVPTNSPPLANSSPAISPGLVGNHLYAGNHLPSGSQISVTPTLTLAQRVLAAAQAQHTRPFKAYPKDPLCMASSQDESYIRFRDEMLSQVRGGKNCQRKRPSSPIQSPDSKHELCEEKDAAYWERRRKNNEAAKRSRDARRAKEDEIAIRAAFLEQENLQLKYQLAVLSEEVAHLRCMLYKTDHNPSPSGMVRYPPMV